MADFGSQDRWLDGMPSPIQEDIETGSQNRWMYGLPSIIQQAVDVVVPPPTSSDRKFINDPQSGGTGLSQIIKSLTGRISGSGFIKAPLIFILTSLFLWGCVQNPVKEPMKEPVEKPSQKEPVKIPISF